MGEAGRLEAMFRASGIDEVVMSEHDGTAAFPSVEEFVATEIQAWLLADSVDSQQIDAIVNLLRTQYPPFEKVTGAVSFPLNALVGKTTRV